jgi:subtilisin family serine protease
VDQPAWSEQFLPDRLGRARALPLPQPITREWAWDGATGRGVKVAVVDSGIDGSHPRVGGIDGGVALEYDPDAPDGVRVDEGDHEDLFGHGTACAGIIRAIAPDCQLFSIRVLGPRLTGKGFIFAAGLRWAIDHGMDVVNLSLSTGRRDYYAMFHELADAAYFANVMLVCAVNNVRTESYPSLYSSVFSVATRPDARSLAFSYNPSPPVEFGAAGIDVDVAWLEHGSITATGNSFACPVITGTIARVLSKHPGLTPFQVKTVLQATADNAVTT